MQELHTLCSSELRLRESGVFPEAVVSVLLEERKFREPGSFTPVLSACEDSDGEDNVCLADKWRMMLHWSEITSLSHCKEKSGSKVSPDNQSGIPLGQEFSIKLYKRNFSSVPVVALRHCSSGWMAGLPKNPGR